MTVAAPSLPKLSNYINGHWADSNTSEWQEVINPATGETLAQVPLSSPAEVAAAVDAAAAAFLQWRRTPPEEAAAKLIPLVYEELRRLAVRRLSHERPNHTLQATALVHEAYLKLAAQENAKWQNRAQFYAVTSQTIRRILVDYARGQQRIRRGGKQQKVSLDDVLLVSRNRSEELLAVHESLSNLEGLDSRQARIVEM